MFILLMKVESGKMTDHTSHRHRTASPWWAKNEVKLVVLYKRSSSNISLVIGQLALQSLVYFSD